MCEVFLDVFVLLGGIEVFLCCIVYYDYWLDKVCCLVLMDLKVDFLMYGNGECLIIEVMYCLVKGEKIYEIIDVCGMVFIVNKLNCLFKVKFVEIVLNDVDIIGCVDLIINFYVMIEDLDGCEIEKDKGNFLI